MFTDPGKILIRSMRRLYDKPREGDIKDSLGDISRAKEKMGYEPKYELGEGLKETMEYFKVMLK